MPTTEMWKEIFNYGTPFVILAVITWGVIKFGKWASGILNEAILNTETGWLAAVNRTANATETYLRETAERDQVQQRLCEQHAVNLQETNTVLKGHLDISKKTLEGLEEFREEVTSLSTEDTNRMLNGIQAAICEACDATKELVAHAVTDPQVASKVASNCEKIKRLVKG